jgi:hypothetical protein
LTITTLIALIGVRFAAILAQCVTLMEVAPSGSEGTKTTEAMIATMNHGKRYTGTMTTVKPKRNWMWKRLLGADGEGAARQVNYRQIPFSLPNIHYQTRYVYIISLLPV